MVLLTMREISAQKRVAARREQPIRQINRQAVVLEAVVDIFDAVGMEEPEVGLLDDEFPARMKNLPECNLAVEVLEWPLDRARACVPAGA